MEFAVNIGLEVHAELQTRSKMFCSCPVVDSTLSEPNTAVCPVCSGMPGVLPVVNRQAVEHALRVALALECTIQETSIFARKNYFYPDLPKGYQISQYESPIALGGRLVIDTSKGPRTIRITRVHLEEDTGKLTHINNEVESCSLVDLNRAGVPLLEIVTEPDIQTLEEMHAYAASLRSILRALGACSGDMEKGAIRFEANISIRPVGRSEMGTRVEIKNLNSFRALERSTGYQIDRQAQALERGNPVRQETLGWDETSGTTFSQRSKEEAHDYRYFPEPDLPPLVIDMAWIERVSAGLPELPRQKTMRFTSQFGLAETDARKLTDDRSLADYFEACVKAAPAVPVRTIFNWITGELFAWMNMKGQRIDEVTVTPASLGDLLESVTIGKINLPTAKKVFSEMLETGKAAADIISERGLLQHSDSGTIAALVETVLADNSRELAAYLGGKENLANWFFGQAMQMAGGKANPQLLRVELMRRLGEHRNLPPE